MPSTSRAAHPGKYWCQDHIVRPQMVAGMRASLGLPPDRALAGDIVDRYVRLNPQTRAVIDGFAADHMTGPVIGLHIRGAGRAGHGGSARMRALLDPANEIPYEHYFRAVDAALADHPEARVLVCSDSGDVIDRARARFGARTLVYPATRTAFGEMHENHPKNEGRQFSPYQLGLDVVAEAHLLARCVHFVHGNSNVANFVLCRAPGMPSTYVYGPVVARFIAETVARRAGRPPR